MTDAPLIRDEADDAEAAEYVIGLQHQAERAATAARIEADPNFGSLVTAWQVRLQGLNDAYSPVATPDLLPALESRLFRDPVRTPRRGGLLPWLAGAAVATVLVLATLATLAPPGSSPLAPGSDLVAVLSSIDARLIIEVRHSDNTLTVTRTVGPTAVGGRVHEVWLIAPDAAPVSLGLLADASLTIAYPRPPEGWSLAVSIEPEGGSRYGTPTGPVILQAVIGQEP